jgi:signal peptidase I
MGFAFGISMIWRSKMIKFVRQQVVPFLLILLIGFSFKSAIADWNTVPSGSMRPTILEGDRIWVNKLAYGLKVPFTTWRLARWATPQRGDIIVFFSPKDGTRLVKRVIGLPGDVVQLADDRLIINGKSAAYSPVDPAIAAELTAAERPHRRLADESYGKQKHPVMATPELRAMRDFGPVTVPAKHYLVLGDNRDNSADSRYIGFVPIDDIDGRTSTVIFSINYRNYWLPRAGRWFYSLP